MEQDKGLKLDLMAWDFASQLVQGLWFYICQYYGEKVHMPKTVVAFITDRVLKRYVKTFHHDLSKSVVEEYGQEKDISALTMIYLGSVSDGAGGSFRLIAIRKAGLARTRRYFMRHFRRDVNLSETLLIPLIHETIHLFEEVTGKTYLDHSTSSVTQAEKVIFSQFKNDHNEYFSEQNEKNISKLMAQVPDQ
jgi:hypothetical protein